MGRSTPTRQLYCSRCKEKWHRRYQLSNFNPEFWRWFNVQVVGDQGGRALIRCLTCGHEYLSKSVAAQRGLAAFRKRQNYLAN